MKVFFKNYCEYKKLYYLCCMNTTDKQLYAEVKRIAKSMDCTIQKGELIHGGRQCYIDCPDGYVFVCNGDSVIMFDEWVDWDNDFQDVIQRLNMGIEHDSHSD